MHVAVKWSVVLPFYNERDFLAGTLASLAGQSEPLRLILVDNGSTDGSGERAARICARLGLQFTLIAEPRAGKVHALAAGLAAVTTAYVATCDADTWYPADYLHEAGMLLAKPGRAAAGCYYAPPSASRPRRWAAAAHVLAAAALLPRQCHAGGAGQVFRTDALRAAGGFSAARWNWVMEDHEIMHRAAKVGSIGYGGRFWCVPSQRERDRTSIRWTLSERLGYHFCPGPWRDRFFYDYLAQRLRTRRMTSDRIRVRSVPAFNLFDHASDPLRG